MNRLTTTAAIIAGGAATRMAGLNKPLLKVDGEAIIAHIIRRIAKNVPHIVINTNQDPATYASFGYPVIPDCSPNQTGPLLGILSVIHAIPSSMFLCVPGDVPFFPNDLAAKLIEAMQNAHVMAVIAAQKDVPQPMFALCRREIASNIQVYLAQDRRKLEDFWRSIPHQLVNFSCRELDFFNVNTATDLATLEQLRTRYPCT